MKYLNAVQHVSFHLCQKAFLSFNNVLDVDKDDLNVEHYDADADDDSENADDYDVDNEYLSVVHYDGDTGDDDDDDHDDDDDLNVGHYDDDAHDNPHLDVGRPHPLVQQHALGHSLGNALLQQKLSIWRYKPRYDIYQRQTQR